LISSAGDDELVGGRDAFFNLDGAQDLFVYTGSGRWSEESSFFGDTIQEFEDGIDLFDLRGSGLIFDDLTIINDEFQTTIIANDGRGQITIFESFGAQVDISAADFLFG
jgi:hypothetical protein